METLVQEPATAVSTSDKELKAVRVKLNAVSVKLRKMDEKSLQ
jgi:hypothetical protein